MNYIVEVIHGHFQLALLLFSSSHINHGVLGSWHDDLDSQSDSSMATSDVVAAARLQVLNYLNASPRNYKCIFTSGATAALKLVGECFPWSRESCYMYTMENHNSVLGIREYPSCIENYLLDSGLLYQIFMCLHLDILSQKPSS